MTHFNGVKDGDIVIVTLDTTHMSRNFAGTLLTGEIRDIILSGEGTEVEYNSAYLRIKNTSGISKDILIEAGPGAMSHWQILSIEVAQ
jgi:glycosylphosphatidylinositol transamidase (GPIT) subunit GPI8